MFLWDCAHVLCIDKDTLWNCEFVDEDRHCIQVDDDDCATSFSSFLHFHHTYIKNVEIQVNNVHGLMLARLAKVISEYFPHKVNITNPKG